MTWRKCNVSQKDIDVLCEFYHALGGIHWKNNSGWLDTSKVCVGSKNGKAEGLAWFGTKWEDGRIIGLDLTNNNLHGMIPMTVGNLDTLKSLKLNQNMNLKGSTT